MSKRGGDPEEERRYFSVAEANSLVPELERRFSRISERVDRIRDTTSYLSSLGGAHPGPLRHELRRVYDEIQIEVAGVQAHGCIVKDVTGGLVDFWHRKGDADVLLCWKHGEGSVDHFHDPESGFDGRRPLDAEAADPGDDEDGGEGSVH